jgi:hypothetical protein
MAKTKKILLSTASNQAGRTTAAAPREAEPKAAKDKAEKEKTPVELKMYTITEFCEAHNISLDSYYRMQRTGTGPEIKKIGQATRISVEAAKAWREAGKAATKKASEAASAEADA